MTDALPILQTTSPDLLGMPMAALERFLEGIGVGERHAGRVFRGLHYHRQPLAEVQSLGWRHVQAIQAASTQAQVQLTAQTTSDDGTRKLLFQLADGSEVEAVLIPMKADRLTLCVSSQVGCAMGCTFCATGTLGLKRGLTAGEIVAQVHAASTLAAAQSQRVNNIVFMGMGEPLHHYTATRDALRILRDDRGPCFKARKLTVSTVGVVPKMRTFAKDFGGRVQLALSLHAGTDAVRQRIIPLAEQYDMATLKQALLDHPLPGSRYLMLEYVILPGVNDTDAELAALAKWTEGLKCLVNLIPFNPFPGAAFRAPSDAEIHSVNDRLRALKVPASVRWPKGRGVAGACGQLALRNQ